MPKREKYELIAGCIALLATGTFAIYSASDPNLFCSENAMSAVGKIEAPSCFEFWLNRYQTLISAAVALLAAITGFRAVQTQAERADRLEQARLMRANLAARSTMPLALSAVCDYAEACIRAFEALRSTRADSVSAAPPELPTFPDDIIEPLRRAVEFSEPTQAKEIADVLATAQVFLARIRDMSWAHRPTSDLQYRMFDAADIYARASRLFDYARGDTMNRHLVMAEDIRSAFHLFQIDLGEWPLVQRRLELKQEAEARVRGNDT